MRASLLLLCSSVFSALPFDLLVDAAEGFWRERRLSSRPSTYAFVERAGEPYLVVESTAAASALYRTLDITVHPGFNLSWRWRVEKPLEHALPERTRDGDDYAARVAVMFDGKPFGRKTRAMMYVWAQGEQVGSRYASPYAENVRTLVLQNDDSPKGRWVAEHRDVFRDFEQSFGESPGRITAVAVMVDTDNTGSRAVTWFDRLRIGRARYATAP